MYFLERLNVVLLYLYIIALPLMPGKFKIYKIPFNGDVILAIFILVYIIKVLFLSEVRVRLIRGIKNFFRDYISLFAIFIFILMVISVLYAMDRKAAINESARFATYLILFFIIRYDIESVIIKEKLIKCYLSVTGLISIIGIIQYVTGKGLMAHDPHSGLKGVASTLENPNILGAFLILAIFPLIMLIMEEKTLKLRVTYIITTILVLLNIILSFSRNVWLGLAFGCVIFALMYSLRLGIIFVTMGAASLFIPKIADRIKDIGSMTQNISRLKIWQTALYMIKDHPILGVGNGNFPKRYAEYISKHPELNVNEDIPHPHNVIIKYESELGILGLVGILGLMVSVILKLRKTVKETVHPFLKPFYKGFIVSVISFYFINLLDNFFTAPKVIAFFWILIAIGDSIGNSRKA